MSSEQASIGHPSDLSVALPDPDDPAPAGEEADERLAAEALERMHDAEKQSGFGRFAKSIHGLFQTSPPSSSRSRGPLRAAPIMMAVGALLLLATGLLFLLSKPEPAVSERSRQRQELSGRDDHSSVASPSYAPPVVREDQLNGGDMPTRAEQAQNRPPHEGGSRNGMATHRSIIGGDEGGPSTPSTRIGGDELRTPATVFTASASPRLASNLDAGLWQGDHPEVQLPSGIEIVAHTTNAISSGLESPVVAIVDRSVEFDDEVVIPQGTRVIGHTAGVVKDRINVRFTSLLLPSHREMAISGLALMKDGSAGLTGKVQGSGHPILASAGRIATGTAVLAAQFAGNPGMNQPFSQGDYLRNQLASEVASEGSRASSRWQQPVNVPIVKVNTNQSIRIFLLSALDLTSHRGHSPQEMTTVLAGAEREQNDTSVESLGDVQTSYIQSLESQLADLRAELEGRQNNGRH